MNKKPSPSMGREKFFQRYKIHLAATGFAVIIWFLVVSNGTFDYEVDIPVERPPSQLHLTLSGELPATARIGVRGEGLALLSLILFREGRLEIRPDWEPGRKTIYPSTQDVRLFGSAKNLTVLRVIEPAEIVLLIEPFMRKRVPVRLQAQIRPQPGYTVVGEPQCAPELVEISGGESDLAGVDSIDSEPLRFDNRTTSFTASLRLMPPPGRLLLEYEKIDVQVNIQKLMEKKINNIGVSVIHLPPGVRALVMPARLSLVADGGVDVVAALTERDIHAYIDYGRFPQQESGDYPAYIQPIPWVRFRDIEPKRFKVVLEKE